MNSETRPPRPRHLWPRGRLDIGWQDLSYAATTGWAFGKSPQSVWPATRPHLATLSVRTAWDALLAIQQWPVNSEIIFSEANIPDMVHIMKTHGYVPVPAPLNPDTLALDPATVESLVTSRTRAILFSPLFGSRTSLKALRQVADKHNLLLVEDNAQAYSDSNNCGSPEADVTLFSFGLIKTQTALGGAVVFTRAPELLEQLKHHMAAYPTASTLYFYRRLGRAALLQLLSHPLLFGYFWYSLERRGLNPDEWLSQATRGMAGQDLFKAIRKQPHRGTLRLLRRRLHQTNSHLRRRIKRGQDAQQVLPSLLGQKADSSVFWALPVCVSQREELVVQARSAGFDVSYSSSSLISHSPTPTAFSRALEAAVFLPAGTPMSEREWQRLLQLTVQFTDGTSSSTSPNKL